MLQNTHKGETNEFGPFKTKVVENFSNTPINFNSKIILNKSQITKKKFSNNPNIISIHLDNQDNLIDQNIDSSNNIISNIEINNDNGSKFSSGRWSKEEHIKFIEGILEHGNEWKKVQQIIGTRTSTQARSHAQKFFLKMKKEIGTNRLNDKNELMDNIIDVILPKNKKENLTKQQKEKLINAIYSNIKSDEDFNNEIAEEKENDNKLKVTEEDNLVYEKEPNNIILNSKKYKENTSIIGTNQKEKKFSLFKKRKSSKLSDKKEKIFTIQKDLSHKSSLDITSTVEKIQDKIFQNNNENDFQKNENIKNNDENSNSNINNKNYIIQNFYQVTNHITNENYYCNYCFNDVNNTDNMWNNQNDYLFNNEKSQNYFGDFSSGNLFQNGNQFNRGVYNNNENEHCNNELNTLDYNNINDTQNYKGNNDNDY